MRATYDADADALSVTLLANATRVRTVTVAPGILAHFDRERRLIEFEILGASEHYSRAVLERIESPAEYLTLVEAAKESGLDTSTLRRQLLKGRLTGEKRGPDWLVTRAALETYLDNREPRGRPAKSRKARRRRKVSRRPVAAATK